MLAPLHETAAAAPELYVYGPLGIGCVVFAGVIVVLWRTLRKQGDSHHTQLSELTNRHVRKAEEWSASHAQLSQDLKQLLQVIVRREPGA